MASASSSFVGTENPLSESAAWTALTAYWQTMRKATGAATNSATTGNDCAARYTGVTFSADHFSEMTLKAVPTGGQLYFHYLFARMNSTASAYLFTTAADIGANIVQLYRVDNTGSYTQIGANITLGANMAANDVMRLECSGTGLTCKYNGTTVRTATDSTFATGQPGIGGWVQNAGSDVVIIASWNAADITATTVSMPPIRARTPSYLHSL